MPPSHPDGKNSKERRRWRESLGNHLLAYLAALFLGIALVRALLKRLLDAVLK